MSSRRMQPSHAPSSSRDSVWPVVCACGRSWSREAWRALRYVGVARFEPECHFEMRNCTCRSTLSTRLARALPVG